MAAMARPVSRETVLPVRKFSQERGDKTRERLISGVIEYAKAGHFRATSRQLGQYADVHHSAVIRHFGALDLLYRVVAREHWDRVFPDLPFAMAMAPLREADARAAVWAVLVGAPRELS